MIRLAQFPIRPRPYPAEGIRNYVYRVYTTNGYTINLKSKYRPWLRGWFEEVGRWKPGDALEAPFMGAVSPSDPLVSLCVNQFKYCPQCARDLGYQIWSTDYASAFVCSLHLVALRITCPACDVPVDALVLSEGSCRCGRSFADDVEESLPAAQAAWELALCRDLGAPDLQEQIDHHRAMLPSWLRELQLTELASLLNHLGKLDSFEAVSSDAGRSRELLDRWPTRLHARLGDIAKSWKGSNSAVIDKRYFLRRSPLLEAFVSHTHCSEVAAQIEQFFDVHRVSVRHITNGANEVLVNPSVVNQAHISRSQWTCEDMAQELEWPVWAVADAIETLDLPAVTLPYLRISVESEVALDFMSRVKGYIPIEIAGDNLGIMAHDFIGLLQIVGVQPRFIEVLARQDGKDSRSLKLTCLRSKKTIERAVFSRCRRLVPRQGLCVRKPIWDLAASEDYLRCKPRWHNRRPSDDRAQAAVAKTVCGVLKGTIAAFYMSEPLSLADLYVDDGPALASVPLMSGGAR